MTTIFVTHSFVGFHRWPGAPPPREYLADEHRHLFGVRVEVNVEHDDREIEFHDLRDAVAGVCKTLGTYRVGHMDTDTRDLGPMSCEGIAWLIVEKLSNIWPNRKWIVTVDEDGECGATVQNEVIEVTTFGQAAPRYLEVPRGS